MQVMSRVLGVNNLKHIKEKCKRRLYVSYLFAENIITHCALTHQKRRRAAFQLFATGTPFVQDSACYMEENNPTRGLTLL